MKHNTKINLSIVFPAYNEEDNIATAVNGAVKFAEKNTNDYEVVVVNDGSKDKTKEVVEELIKHNNKIKLVDHKVNKGYGQTVKDGLKAAIHEWVFFIDSDGQFNINELEGFFKHTEFADFIVGRRYDRKDPFMRKLNAKMFNIAVKIGFGIRVRDIDCAFKLMRKTFLDRIDLVTTGAMINTELVHKAQKLGAKFVEIDVTHYERTKGSPTGAKPSVIFRAMKEYLKYKKQTVIEETDWLGLNIWTVGVVATVIATIGTMWSYKNNAILAYGDAEAHLNIAKRVVDSLTPGLSQIGGVWLPLPHALMLPFVWNDFLWRTGLAGSIVSSVAFIWAAVILYKLSYMLTKDKLASWAAPLVWITNPNSIYLATTPMSEIVLFASVSTALYYLIKWIRERTLTALSLAGVFSFAATLTRYDGWFLVCMGAAVVGLISLIQHKSLWKSIGNTIVYVLPAFFGIFLWLLWNQLIFGSFMFFANSDYGSKAQQMWFYARGYLPTYKDALLSFIYYLTDSWLVVGPLLALAAIGAVVHWFRLLIKKQFSFGDYAVYLLLFSLGFYTISLFTGQASLILPTFAEPWYQWQTSNVRYGVQMILPAAVFIAMLIQKRHWLIKIATFAIIASQFYYFTNVTEPIVYVDGTRGLSSQKISKGEDAYPVEKWMAEHYEGGFVIMDDYRRPISPVASGIPMDKFISVGTKPYWEESLDNPTKYADWIIIQKASTDAFWENLKSKNILEDHFSVVFKSGNIWVYKKDNPDEQFASKQGQKTFVNGEEFYFYGVNIYDLANMSQSNIDVLLDSASELGMKAIRIWGFNKQSTLTETDFRTLDYALSEATKRDIKLIIVFGNQWNDYGGREAFVNKPQNPDSFYTDRQSIERYKEYIQKLVSRTSSISGKQYKDDPTILAWELLNEPRLETDLSGEIVLKWVEEMAEYVHLLDSKHLVSVGTEGFVNDDNQMPYSEKHGVDFRAICNTPAIDICSVHLYPKYFYNNLPTELDIESLLDRWQNIAEEANKPLYIGEVGFDLSDPAYEKYPREEFFNMVSRVVRRKNINGALLWNLTLVEGEFYSITPFGEENRKLLIDWTSSY